MLAQDARLDTARRRARYGSTPVAVPLDARLDTARCQARRRSSILDATEHGHRLDALDAGSNRLDVNPRRRLDAPRSGLDSSMPGLS